MVAWNPDVPEIQPKEWYKASNPISSVEGDKSLGIALAGAGDLFSSAVKVADSATKTYLNEKVSLASEEARTEATNNANILTDIVSGNVKVRAPGESLSLTPQDVQNPPVELSALPKVVQNIVNAKTARNDLDSHYNAQLMAIAKRYRDQFPGYRDYIDNTISSVTGRNPANAEYSNALSRLNNLLGSQSQKRDKVMSDLEAEAKAGNQEAMGWSVQYRTGNMSYEEVYNKIAAKNATKYEASSREADLKLLKGQREKLEILSTKDATISSSEMANTYFTTASNLTGKSVEQMHKEILSGNLNSEQSELYGRAIEGMKQRFLTEARKRFDTVIPDIGESRTSLMGGVEKRDAMLIGQAKVFDVVSSSVYDKNYGMASWAQRASDAIVNDRLYSIYKNKDIGPAMSTAAAFKSLGPEIGAMVMPQLVQQGIKTGMDVYWQEQVLKGYSQPGATTGKITTLNGVLKDFDGNDVKFPDSVEKVLGIIDGSYGFTRLGNSDSERKGKANAILMLYHPDNAGVLRNFEKEGYDVKNGKVVTGGQYSVFARLYSPEATQAVLSTGNRQLWEMYKNSMDRAYTNDLVRDELKDFTKLSTENLNPKIRIGWDDSYHNWKAYAASNATSQAEREGLKYQIDYINSRLEFINRATNSFASVYKAEGKDTDTVNQLVLRKVIEASGVDVSSPNFTGIPKMMLQAIAAEKEAADLEAQQIKSKAIKKKSQ